MGIFSRNYNKPGPGVSKDEPRKKGVRRFLEILGRDSGDLVKLNLLFLVCIAPSVALFVVGFMGFIPGVTILLSVAAAFPIGGATVAAYYCITKMLYDDPGFLWHDFKRKFVENYKQAAVPGILCTAFTYAQLMLWTQFIYSETGAGSSWFIPGIITLLLFAMVAPYIFLQIAYVNLKTLQVIKNCVLMSFAKAPRSFMGAILGGVIWIACILFFPASFIALPLVLLLGFTLSWLMNLMWIWPNFDKLFAVEETIRKRQAEEEQLTIDS